MKRFSLLLYALIIICNIPSTIKACSAFRLQGKDYCVVGFNENWNSMPGLIVINKRNIDKENLSWKQLISRDKVNEPKIQWTSRYGSVSFNLLGIDMPCYGVNEKGLFIVELYLDKTYSINDDKKANMFWGQWIQYQLDNYSTTDEVLANLNNAPVIDWWPTFPGSHFFLCDKAGNTAAIELIEGVFKVSTGATMPVPVLCNDQYQTELSVLKQYKKFGGATEFDINTQKWEDRFAKAAYMISNYDKTSTVNPVDYSWGVLDSIKPGVWQLVYDMKNSQLQFRSDVGKGIKNIDMSTVDFSNKTPVSYLDINADLSGNVLSKFSAFSAAVNRQYVEKGFPIGYENAEFYSSQGYVNLKKNLNNYIKKNYGL